MKKTALFIVVAFLVIFILYLNRNLLVRQFFSPIESSIQQGLMVEDIPQTDQDQIEIVADNLEIPWDVAFLPDGDILVTERPGRLLRIGFDRQVIEIQGVYHRGEGGLLGLALHPNFEENQWIYLYLTSLVDNQIINRVERYQYDGNQLRDRLVIISYIPGAQYHDGGRIEFGPDGYLYVTTGDAGVVAEAQNKDSIHGSILRVSDDGSIPQDNPFGSIVYTYGHRNPQGLAWDEQGNLWSTEHGRSGVRSGFDEVNLIVAGQNYGWPKIEGDAVANGLVKPKIHSGANDTWAPGDVEYFKGKLFFTGLRGESIYELSIENNNVVDIRKHFTSEFGRLRAIRLGQDGYFYITTSNRDGRGDIEASDDKLIKINPKVFGL